MLPTRNENFAMTVAESLAAATPVICTKGAPWAGLAANGCGWWIDHGSEALAAALDQAMTLPPDRLRAMGERGRAWMQRDFAWDGVAVRMAAVYRWLARGGDRPAFVRTDCNRIMPQREALYQPAPIKTHKGDSQTGDSLNQCGD